MGTLVEPELDEDEPVEDEPVDPELVPVEFVDPELVLDPEVVVPELDVPDVFAVALRASTVSRCASTPTVVAPIAATPASPAVAIAARRRPRSLVSMPPKPWRACCARAVPGPGVRLGLRRIPITQMTHRLRTVQQQGAWPTLIA
jgi:hypothetical protein